MRCEVLGWSMGQMGEKLDANSFKRGHGYETISWQLNRLKQEAVELEDALERAKHQDDIDHGRAHMKDRVVKECADVANFAMFIADLSRRDEYQIEWLQERKRNKKEKCNAVRD